MEVFREDKDWIEEWNRLHCIHTRQGAEYRNDKMAEFLEEVLPLAKKHYYLGDPLMSDQRFDLWEDNLRLLKPNSKLLNMVGYKHGQGKLKQRSGSP